jgi:hypothetical protein
MTSLSDMVAMGNRSSRLEIRFQTIQSYPYRAGLATPCPTCLQTIIALAAGCCPLGLSTSGQLLTQEPSSQFLLAAPGIPSCAMRRTLSACRRSRSSFRTMLVRRLPFAVHHSSWAGCERDVEHQGTNLMLISHRSNSTMTTRQRISNSQARFASLG